MKARTPSISLTVKYVGGRLEGTSVLTIADLLSFFNRDDRSPHMRRAWEMSANELGVSQHFYYHWGTRRGRMSGEGRGRQVGL